MSRNGQGNYTPPLGDVVGGQLIEADWANTTIDDIATALTDSLSRSGNGGMLSAFRAVDGSINVPSISFNNETNSGIYKAGTGDYRLCVNGKDKARIRDVDGMAAFQVFDLNGTDAWETLATASDLSSLTLAGVLAVGNTTGGSDIVLTDGDVITGTADPVIRPPAPYTGYGAPGIELQTSSGSARISTSELETKLWYGVSAGVSALKLATTDSGVTVTGDVAATTVTVGDSTGTNLELYEDGSQNAIIRQRGTGSLQISGINGSLSNDNYEQLLTWGSDAIHLSWQGTTGAGTKLSTTSTGINVTGTVEADGIDVTGTVEADGFSGTGTVTVTDFIDDDSFATASATNVPTAESVKAYVDSEVGGQDTLAEILAVGNTTGGTDIEISGGSNITSSQTGGFTIESTQGLSLFTDAGFTAGIGANFSVFSTTTPTLPRGSVAIIPTTSRGSGNPAVIFNYTDAIFYDNIRLNDSTTMILANDDIRLRPAAAKETRLETSTGVVRLQATDTVVNLYYGATAAQTAVKLQTSADGIDVTGTVESDGLLVTTVSNEPALETTGELRIASSNTGSVSMGVNGAGNFYVANTGFPSLGTGTTSGQFSIGLQVTADNILCYKPLKFNALGTEISKFSSDGTFASPSNTELPTTQAVKTYVDNAAFPTTTNNAADIAYTAFNTFSGKRIINTASATNTTYGLPTPVAADVGKSWVICNPTDSEITIDHDASGTANYIWIMDGVTLSAAASSWTIKKGAIVEIVVVASDSGGGSATAPNYLIFGAGLLEIV